MRKTLFKPFSVLILALLSVVSTLACDYTVVLYDSYGDGWNGGSLTVFVNGVAVQSGITLGSGGTSSPFVISVNSGDEISTSYTSGSWSYENSYKFFDSEGNEVWSQGNSSMSGLVASCPGLQVIGLIQPGATETAGTAIFPELIVSNGTQDTLANFDVQYTFSTDTFTLTYADTLYPAEQDTMLFANSFTVPVGNYVLCAWAIDTAAAAPISFCEALFGNPANDAGVTAILAPLGQTIEGQAATPTIIVENFGTAALTAMDINYDVAGVAGTTFVWTGNLAFGETDTVDLPAFIMPATAVDICIYTALAGDQITSNDTACAQLNPIAAACNYAVEFDGTGDWIEVLSDTSLNAAEYTLEAWVKPYAFSWLDGIISRYPSGGPSGYVLRLSPSYPNNKINFNEADASQSLNTNEWYHLAAVRAGGSNTLYINGVQYNLGGNALSGDNNAILQIGCDYNERYWNGLIDEVRIWGTGLSQAEIIEWSNKPVDATHPQYNELNAYYEFNAPGATAIDSKNNNTGYLHDNTHFVPCDAPFVCGDWDGGIAEFYPAMNQAVAGQSIAPSVVITNMGVQDITSMTISYSVNGATATQYTYSGLIASASSDTVTLPAFIATAGTSNICVWTELANDINANNDTLCTSFDALNDICNYSLDLDGNSQYGQLPAGNYFGTQFSVEGWVYKRSNGNSSRFIDFATGTNDNVYISLSEGTSGKVGFAIRQGSSHQDVVSPNALPLNQWVHLSCTYDGVVGKIYFDGVEQVSGNIHNPLPVVRDNCWVGRSAWSSNAYADVNIDEFRMWNTVLLPTTITNYMNVPIDATHPNYTDLAVYYNFNQAVDNPVPDQAGTINMDILNGTYSENSSPVVCDPYDAAITAIVEPTGILMEASQIIPEVILTNLGTQPLTSATLYYTFGIDTFNFTYTGNLLLGTSDTLALTAITAPYGSNTDLCVWVELANDANPANDMQSQNYTLMVNACNYALEFDGNSDYVQVPNGPDMAGLGAVYTLECWIKPAEFQWLDGIISKYHTGGQANFTLRMGQNSPYNTLNFDEQDAGPAMQVNQWYHIAAVNNNGIHKLYVNGVEFPTSASATYSPNGSYIRFGSDYNSRFYKGLMDEVRIWDAALTQSDVTTWMNVPVDAAHPEYVNLLGYWKFDDLAPMATDSKGANDGTINDCIYVPSDAPVACGLQDAGVSAILMPTTNVLEGALNNVEVTVFNYGTDMITAMDVAYSVNGGVPVVYNWTGNLAPVTSENISLPAFIGPAGTSTMVAYTSLTGDVVTYNDSSEITLTSIPAYELAMGSVLSPGGGCGMTNAELVSVELMNNGDTITSGLTMYYMIGGDSMNIVSEVFADIILPNSTYQYTFATPADLFVGLGTDSIYNFDVWFEMAIDADSTNNVVSFNIESLHASDVPIGYGATVLYGDTAVLTAESPNAIFWYDAPSGGNLLSSDTFMVTPPLFDTTTYWVTASEYVPFNLTIGTGTSSTKYIPAYGYYNNSWSSCLYTAAEIGAPMQITSIAYNVKNTPSNYTMLTQKIYMANTPDASFANGNKPDPANYTLVFEGDITWNGSGWHEIILDTPFDFNGADNLEIYYENWDGSWSSGYPKFKYTSHSGMAKYNYADASMPGNAYSTSNYRANIQLNGASVGCPSAPVPVVATVTNIPTYDLAVTQILSPSTGFLLSSCEDITIEILNQGAQDATAFPINFELDNGTSFTEIYPGVLQTGQSVTYTFSSCVDASIIGTYGACAYVNLTGDTYNTNDTLCFSFDNNELSYCPSNATSTSYIEVTNFGINGWTNYSGPATGSTYSDFIALTPPEAIIGQTIMTMVDPTHYYSTWDVFSNYKIYIDYNQDGTYDPVTEMAFGSNVWGQNLSYGSVTIPATATPGTTGMRLVFVRTDNANNVNPCGTYSYGETEDYMITLHAPLAQDAGITAIIEPSGFMIENTTEPVQVTMTNFGSDTIFACDIVYTIDGLNPMIENWTGALAPFTSIDVDLANLTVPQLDYDLCAYTILAGDTNYYNDTTCTSLYGDPQYQAEIVSVTGLATGCNLGLTDVVVTFGNLADTIMPGMLTISYEVTGIASTVTETFNDTLMPGMDYTFTFGTQLDQTVTAITEFDFHAWINLANDPFTSNDSLNVVYWSSISPADPMVADTTIFANQTATMIPNPIDTNVVYAWYNQYMSQLGTGTAYTTAALTDTTLYNIIASYPAMYGGCQSNPADFTVNVEYADFDAAITDIVNPVTGAYLSTSEAVTIEIYNNGLNDLWDIPVSYSLNGVAVSATCPDTIQPGTSVLYTFADSANLFQTGYGPNGDGYGAYDLCAYTTLTTDGFNGNDTLCTSVINMDGDGTSCATAFPYGYVNDPAVNGSIASYESVWYSFEVVGNYSNVEISLCGSNFDTEMDLYDACNAFYLATNDQYCGNQSQIDMTSLSAGTYYVKVYGYYSSNGDYVLEITGTQDDPFALDLDPTMIACNGSATGEIDLTVNNIIGATPFTFEWSTLETTEDITGLAAGTYAVTVVDANNDTVIGQTVITEPDMIVVAELITDVTTLGINTGAIDLDVTGGVSPYDFLWANGANTEDMAALYGGDYTVTVTDANGCLSIHNYHIGSPAPTGWEVLPTNETHLIMISDLAEVTLDANPVPDGSVVGVFFNQNGTMKCGGWAVWSGHETSITAYGATNGLDNGFEAGENFQWRVFDISQMDEFNGTACYSAGYPNEGTYATGGFSGVHCVEALSIIIHPVNLPFGWSIWSTYVTPTDPNIAAMMDSIDSNVTIVKSGTGLIYWPQYYLNTIGTTIVGEGYQIKMAAHDTLYVQGMLIDPVITTLEFPFGWSIIGYLRTTPIDVVTAMSPIAQSIIIMKSGTGLIYWPLYNLNTIGNLLPGQGYQLKMSQLEQYSYPANTAVSSKSSVINQSTFHFDEAENTGHNMSLGILESAWNNSPEEGDEIAAFDASGKLLGSAVYIDGFNALTIWGDDQSTESKKEGLANGESFTLKLWKHSDNSEYMLTVESWMQGENAYSDDAVAVIEKLTIEGSEGANVWVLQNNPNPFNNFANVEFYLPTASQVTIDIYNYLGEKIAEVVSQSYEQGRHSVTIDATDLSAGNYFFRFSTNGFTDTKTMTVVK